MELRHLRHFVTIAEERSFTPAAERSWVAHWRDLRDGRVDAPLGPSAFISPDLRGDRIVVTGGRDGAAYGRAAVDALASLDVAVAFELLWWQERPSPTLSAFIGPALQYARRDGAVRAPLAVAA